MKINFITLKACLYVVNKDPSDLENSPIKLLDKMYFVLSDQTKYQSSNVKNDIIILIINNIYALSIQGKE